MNGQYRPGDVVLGKWTLTRLIGEGSFGRVYEAEREDFGRVYKAAIKIVTIPQSQSEVQSVRGDGLDDESVTTYFRGFVEEMVGEFALMEQLKGTANVVGYEDHDVLTHDGQIGWDILIRMELLTPLLKRVSGNAMDEPEVIRLGIDLCRALELCRKHKIIHRDIKPENIFVSDNGDYKLGDFGIARTVEKTTGGLSKKGTYTYMAPEVYKGEPYGASADLYSLGLVLYWLTNRNRAPFLPLPPQVPGYNDREEALRRRMSGEAVPAPCQASAALAAVIQKACAYHPKDRYDGPAELRRALEALRSGETQPDVSGPTVDVFSEEPAEPERTESVFSGGPEPTESVFGGAGEKTESVFGGTAPAGTPLKTAPEPVPVRPGTQKAGFAAWEIPAPAAGSAAAMAVAAGLSALWLAMCLGTMTIWRNNNNNFMILAYYALLGLLTSLMAFTVFTQHRLVPMSVLVGTAAGYCYASLVEAPKYSALLVPLVLKALVLAALVLAAIWLLVGFQKKPGVGASGVQYGKALGLAAIPTLIWALMPSLMPWLYSREPELYRCLPRPYHPVIFLLALLIVAVSYGAFGLVYLCLWRSSGGRKRAGIWLMVILVAVVGALAALSTAV